MTKGRLEAFSDGVIAIIITIMVLELKTPEDASLAALGPLLPHLFSYILSFVYVGIYWNNHHHLLHTAQNINGSVMWSNLHLLFWMSLIPLTSAWMSEHNFAPVPLAVYGAILGMCGLAYYILTRALVRVHGNASLLAQAVGAHDMKAIVSCIAYLAAIALAWITPYASLAIYASIAALWFRPDQRIEHTLASHETARLP